MNLCDGVRTATPVDKLINKLGQNVRDDRTRWEHGPMDSKQTESGDRNAASGAPKWLLKLPMNFITPNAQMVLNNFASVF